MKTDKFIILTDSTTSHAHCQADVTFSPRKPLHNVEINIHRDVLSTTLSTPKEASIGRKMAKPRKRTKEISTQTSEDQTKTEPKSDNTVTAADLTGDVPSEFYWRKMAETKTKSLNDALEINRLLSEKIKEMQEEMKIKDEMLEEARAMADVIKDLIGDTAD